MWVGGRGVPVKGENRPSSQSQGSEGRYIGELKAFVLGVKRAEIESAAGRLARYKLWTWQCCTLHSVWSVALPDPSKPKGCTYNLDLPKQIA